jgi:hypothetical protein
LATTLSDRIAKLLSIRNVGWSFAILVFGAYVFYMEVDLWGLSPVWYGGMQYVLADEALPIRLSIYAWAVTIGLMFIGQLAAKPIRWLYVVITGGTTLMSSYYIATILPEVNMIVVPGFLVFYHFQPQIKVGIGLVFALAYVFILLSPTYWRNSKQTKKQSNSG